MFKIVTIFYLVICIFSPQVISAQTIKAQVKQPEDFANKPTMNGFKISDFKDFDKKWKLVTVRYREDSKEIRLTYANDLAYQTLIKNKTNYKNGSIFAKISYITKSDPAFVSSAAPSGTRRFQFMVRDSKRFTKTHDWGYALFNSEGKTFPEDPVEKINSCNACHELVPERGYVFSQPISTDYIKSAYHSSRIDSKIQFKMLNNAEVEKLGIKALQGVNKIFTVDNKLNENIFQGTLDEIKPTLIQKAIQELGAAALISLDHKRYVVVTMEKDKCEAGEFKLKIVQTLIDKDENNEFKTLENYFCKKNDEEELE